jgi:osmotically-inducible protein OsmY
MNRLIVIGAGLLLFWALFQFGGRTQAPAIQADINDRTISAIAAQGLTDLVVSTDGRDVTLTGNVSADSHRQLAETTAAGVYGVRIIDQTPFRLRLSSCA